MIPFFSVFILVSAGALAGLALLPIGRQTGATSHPSRTVQAMARRSAKATP